MSKIMKAMMISGVVAGASVIGMVSQANAATQTSCSVVPVELGSWGKAITIKGDTATATFTVKGENCTTPVTLAAWERMTLEGINDQKLFAYETKTFGPGKHSLSVKVPACYNQIDVVQGARATAADGTANYQFQDGKFVDGGLRDFLKAGNKVCEDKPPVTPEPPVVTPKPPVTPQPPVVTPVATPVAETKSAPVEALPSTGAGSIIAGTMGLSSTAGFAYNYLNSRRKKRMM